MDRSVGAGTLALVVPTVIALFALTAVVGLRARRTGVLTTPATPVGGRR